MIWIPKIKEENNKTMTQYINESKYDILSVKWVQRRDLKELTNLASLHPWIIKAPTDVTLIQGQ